MVGAPTAEPVSPLGTDDVRLLTTADPDLTLFTFADQHRFNPSATRTVTTVRVAVPPGGARIPVRLGSR